MHVTDKIKLPKEILELVEKTNEPMSLDEIVDKFDPPFPFKARRVANSFEGHIFTITGLRHIKKGSIVGHPTCPKKWKDPDGLPCYESEECTHCLGLEDKSTTWYGHVKAWVLV